MCRSARRTALLVLATSGLVAACGILPAPVDSPVEAAASDGKPYRPRIHLPRGGMDSKPVGSTDLYLLRGRIQSQEPDGSASFGADGQVCQVQDTRLHCK